jgi:uncharacterized RDD family membrane protein YckC
MAGEVELPEAPRAPVAMQPGDPWASTAEGGPAGLPPAPGGFLRRGVALGIDLAVMWGLLRVGEVVSLPLRRWDLVGQAFAMTWALVVPAAYLVLCHGTGGQTLGKRLLGVRLVEAGADEVSYGRALVRLLATVLAAAPLGLGLLVAGVRRDRRGLHDLLAGTHVVRSAR